jgi:hypothetical protein
MKSSYLHHTALGTQDRSTDKDLSAVDEPAKRLLEVIALSHAQNRPLTVSAAMALASATSQGTLHHKVKLLRKLCLIYKALTATKA